MLHGGHQVADIALLYPIESVWPRFAPSREWTKDVPAAAQQIERAYRGAAEQLFAHRRDFTYIDARTLAEAEVDAGVLKFKQLRWRVLVLPCVDTLPQNAWQTLRRFWETAGGDCPGRCPPIAKRRFRPQTCRPWPPRCSAPVRPRGEASAANGAGIYLPADALARLSAVLGAIFESQVTVADPKRRCGRRTAASTAVRSFS